MSVRIRVDMPESEWPSVFFRGLCFLVQVGVLAVSFALLVGGTLLLFG